MAEEQQDYPDQSNPDVNTCLKLKFQKLHDKLCALDLSSVIDRLFSSFVLSEANLEELYYIASPRQKAHRLLVILHTSGHPQAFIELRAAIQQESAYAFIIKLIDEEDGKNLTQRMMSEPSGQTDTNPEFGTDDEKRRYSDGNRDNHQDLDEVDGSPNNQEHQEPSRHNAIRNRRIRDAQNAAAGRSVTSRVPTMVSRCVDKGLSQETSTCQHSQSSLNVVPVLLHHRPQQLTTLLADKPVFGVTTLTDRIFVIRQFCPEVEAYDVDNYRQTDVIPVDQLSNPNDMTSSVHFLFIVDCQSPSSQIHRVDVRQMTSFSWSTDDVAVKISATPKSTVLVTFHAVRRLDEFSQDGRLLRRVELVDQDLVNPWHAVILPDTNDIVVVYGDVPDPVHRVCVLDQQGRVERCYGGRKGSSDYGLMSVPTHLSVTSSLLFVADVNNNRVVVLNSRSMDHLMDIKLDECDGRPLYPLRLSLDETRGRLYVACGQKMNGQWLPGRVVVLQIFNDLYRFIS